MINSDFIGVYCLLLVVHVVHKQDKKGDIHL